MSIDYKYYDINAFNELNLNKSFSFATLHLNIALLSKHFHDILQVSNLQWLSVCSCTKGVCSNIVAVTHTSSYLWKFQIFHFEFVKIVMALEKKAFLKNFVELFFVEQGSYTILPNMKPKKLEL